MIQGKQTSNGVPLLVLVTQGSPFFLGISGTPRGVTFGGPEKPPKKIAKKKIFFFKSNFFSNFFFFFLENTSTCEGLCVHEKFCATCAKNYKT